MQTNTQHSPTPWHEIADPAWKGKHPLHDHRFITTSDDIETLNEGFHGEQHWRFIDPHAEIIATLSDSHCQAANAALIVRAVNAHEALVDAIKNLLRWTVKAENDHAFVACASPNGAARAIDAAQAALTLAEPAQDRIASDAARALDEDKAMGFKWRRVEIQACHKSAEHHITINGERQPEMQSLLCDGCGQAIADGSPATAITQWRGGEMGPWEEGYSQ